MKRLLLEYGFPVLGKELVEQAERKRTYLARVIFVVFLSAAFLISYPTIQSSGSQSMLGSGRRIFSFLIQLQMAAIFLYVPALLSGAIAQEKERNSLSLLLLTRLRPGEIIVEKLLGRLTPILTLQFVSLPLLAVAYSLGGVSASYLWACVYLVFVTCLQVGSFALALSAYCRTTVGAFGLSYILVAAMALASWIADGPGRATAVVLSVWTPTLLENADRQTFTECFLSSVPALMSVAALFLLARRHLFRRMHAPARNHLVEVLRGIDRFMHSINSVCGNVVLIPDRSSLPRYEPIAWREVAKKALGKPQYVIRMLLVLELPVVVIAVAAAQGLFRSSAFRASFEPVSLCVFTLWGVAVLVLGVLGTSLIVSERSQQTLGVLLTTPIPRSEIIRQKTRGLARLVKLLWIPFLTLFVFGAGLRFTVGRGRVEQDAGLYFVSSCLTMLIYLPLLGWLATFVGLRSRSRLVAFSLFLACVLVWSAPPLVAYIGGPTLGADVPGSLLLLSPMTMVLAAESGHRGMAMSDLSTWWAVAANAVIHGYILYRLRRACLSGARRHLHAT